MIVSSARYACASVLLCMDADSSHRLDAVNSLVCALAARGTRRESVRGGSVAASMPPHGPASGKDTAQDSLLAVLLKAMRTNQLDWSLPVHPRGTLRGMDAA
ncbi:hypothetical protein XCY_003406 [Xanthomonas arboricola pv. juglandis]|uniref:hypothetical protein n=1 Tax=Xanthomonas arboricola TaxID=56448 RepID=UPI001AF2F870|nr:hypothetical protein [Xanthomonas arboricola]CAG2095247.1 hypothetical protein XCY_003406 [Xanthomonas arboricola pv. juglandis]